MGYRAQKETDLSVDEKKVFGRIIDMWAAEDPKESYAHSTEAKLIKHTAKDGLSQEKVQKILQDLESRGLIRRVAERGEVRIKYKADAAHIVKELQKTPYVYEARDFKPLHH